MTTETANTEAIVLAETFQKVHDLTRWYFSLLKQADPYKQWEVNGQKLNSIIWLAAHIAWAEDYLLLQGTSGKASGIQWLEHYGINSSGEMHDPALDMKTILDATKQIHENAMAHISGISNEKMEEPNTKGIGFGGTKSNRTIIQHAIRHEASHAGHLGWLCKINGIKTI